MTSSIQIIEIAVASPVQVVEVVVAAPVAVVEVVERGLQGPRGPAGSGKEGLQFIQAEASEEWLINHNLGYRPSVSVFTPGAVEVDAGVQHLSTAQTLITFSVPFSGFAYLI